MNIIFTTPSESLLKPFSNKIFSAYVMVKQIGAMLWLYIC